MDNQSTLKVAYSDRGFHKGQKNVQSLDIQIKNKRVVLTTYYHYAGGKSKTTWKNVQVRKEKQGYFITAQSGTGNQTKVLTLAIRKGTCLI